MKYYKDYLECSFNIHEFLIKCSKWFEQTRVKYLNQILKSIGHINSSQIGYNTKY